MCGEGRFARELLSSHCGAFRRLAGRIRFDEMNRYRFRGEIGQSDRRHDDERHGERHESRALQGKSIRLRVSRRHQSSSLSAYLVHHACRLVTHGGPDCLIGSQYQ